MFKWFENNSKYWTHYWELQYYRKIKQYISLYPLLNIKQSKTRCLYISYCKLFCVLLEDFYRVLHVAMYGYMYVVWRWLIRACYQFLVEHGKEVRYLQKTVKGKVHEEPNGESVVGSGLEKHLSSYLPQRVRQHGLSAPALSVWFRKEMTGNADLLNGNLDKTSGRLISLIVTEIAPV